MNGGGGAGRTTGKSRELRCLYAQILMKKLGVMKRTTVQKCGERSGLGNSLVFGRGSVINVNAPAQVT